MLEHAMGSREFFAGVGMYLDQYKYSNADVGDLWDMMTLGSSSDSQLGNITHLMDNWVRGSNLS